MMTFTAWIFWPVVALLVLLSLWAVLSPLLRRNVSKTRGTRDVDIYKMQLAEIERDLERGVLAASEAERTRTEIARRLLAADKDKGPVSGEASRWTNRVISGAMVAAVAGLGVWGYLALGAPGYGDLPRNMRIAQGNEMRENRPSQLESEARITNRITAPLQVPEDVQQMIEQLRVIVPTRPDDLNGWQLLVDNEARLFQFDAAAQAQAHLIALKGAEASETDRYLLAYYTFISDDGAVSPDLQAQITEIAPDRESRAQLWQAMSLDARGIGHFIATTRAQERYIATLGEAASAADYAQLLDYMVTATNGFVSPEAEAVAIRLLQLNEEDPAGLYYAGLLYAQTDRPDRAFDLFRRVLRYAAPDSLHYILAANQIEQTAYLAGQDYSLPETPRGPSAEDIAAASDMDEADRAAMIEGMVASLSERLASSGGTPEEWAQLIRALGVLGQTDRATAIWGEAQQVFADHPEAISTIRAAAQSAGLAQ